MKDTELERDKYLLMVSILSDQNGRNFSGLQCEYVFFEVVPFLDRITYSKNKDMVSV